MCLIDIDGVLDGFPKKSKEVGADDWSFSMHLMSNEVFSFIRQDASSMYTIARGSSRFHAFQQSLQSTPPMR